MPYKATRCTVPVLSQEPEIGIRLTFLFWARESTLSYVLHFLMCCTFFFRSVSFFPPNGAQAVSVNTIAFWSFHVLGVLEYHSARVHRSKQLPLQVTGLTFLKLRV